MSHPIVPILGAGESGTGAALLAVRQGLQPWVSDAGAVNADRATELGKAAGLPIRSGKPGYGQPSMIRIAVRPGLPHSL